MPEKYDNAQIADILIARLNEAISNEKIRLDVERLLALRLPCSKATAEHPMFQVGEEGTTLGVLGFLNGLVGTIDSGPRARWGYITAVFEEDHKLVRFERTKT